MTTLALIAALDRQRAIGRGGGLIWHESEDQKHFRRVTMGCPVIMGRKTWESLPERFRPLPGRRNLVLTREAQWQAAGAERTGSLDEALALVADAPKAFVIGGGELYVQALPRADELVLTEIDAAFDGADTFFPAFDRGAFSEVAREERATADGTRFAFVTYRRFDLQRFVDAQAPVYAAALAELRAGAKRSHWMWFVFPQHRALGRSATALHYGLTGREEAAAYGSHPLLGARLRQCCEALLSLPPTRTAHAIFGSPDDLKLRSSMTLFAAAVPAEPLFARVLARFYGGAADERTLALLSS